MSRAGNELKNLYHKLIKEPWPYWAGGFLLGLLGIALAIVQGHPWGVTTAYSYWAGWLAKGAGWDVDKWPYFIKHARAFNVGFIKGPGSIINVGTILGAFIAAALGANFKIRKLKSLKQVAAAIGGGIIMGYGTRISFGCNIGALLSGTSSLSLHGWLYVLFIIIGAWAGSRFLVRYIL